MFHFFRDYAGNNKMSNNNKKAEQVKKETKELIIPDNFTGSAKFLNHKVHYYKGKIHRRGGPAVEYVSHGYEFWLYGKQVSFDDWLNNYAQPIMKQKKECEDKIANLEKELTSARSRITKLSTELEKQHTNNKLGNITENLRFKNLEI